MSEPSKRGSNGGNARAAKLSKEERSLIASNAAKKRWAKKNEKPYLGPVIQTVGGYDNRVTEIKIGPIPEEMTIAVPPPAHSYQINEGSNHCPACAMGQSLEKGEGTHLLATVEHPAYSLPVESQSAEDTVVIPEPPAPPAKPSKRQAKPMPKEFKTASSYAEKRLLQAVKEKADHVGEIEKHTNCIRKLDTEISELVPIIKALGGKIDVQAGPQQQPYPNPSYQHSFPPIPSVLEDNTPSIDPALYRANAGPMPATSSQIPPPELIPGVAIAGTEELNFDPRLEGRWV